MVYRKDWDMLGLYISIGLLFLAVLISLLYIKVRVNVEFSASPDGSKLVIEVNSIFKRLKNDYPLHNTEFISNYIVRLWEKRQEKKKDPSLGDKKASPDNYSLIVFAAKRLVVEKLDWHSSIGTNDAMYTALGTGGIWAIKGILTGLLSSRTRLQDINLQVEPDFDSTRFNSRLYCILKMRIAHIILIALHYVVLTVRGYINGFRAGKTDPSH
jgi:hypothetical protein